MYLLGLDIGSSSIKSAVIEAETGTCIATSQFPKVELNMISHHPGWAEQKPEVWWEHTQSCIKDLLRQAPKIKDEIKAIGISYQMHGLVVLDESGNVLRPSIIWCDSRAVDIGNQAFEAIGPTRCLTQLLNSPGNFTASKLAWVKEHEPQLFEKIHYFMLPGDYISFCLTGEVNTTLSGLSEGILWDFQQDQPAHMVLDEYNIPASLIPPVHRSFDEHGTISATVADSLGLPKGIPVTYKAGDQPNNALSLNVLNPGEIAATAGTSGVVYGVSDEVLYDPKSRVNTFAHVNYQQNDKKLGILLCVNGTGIFNNWLQKNVTETDYDVMNQMASEISIGSEGLIILPFGNGAERVLENKNPGAHISHLSLNTHTQKHLIRASQEGIAFALKYGIDIMQPLGINPSVIRAGKSNMFLSPIFRQTLANASQTVIELYNTDGAQGAARGAGIGLHYYPQIEDVFRGLTLLETIEPEHEMLQQTEDAYHHWHQTLMQLLT